MKTEFEKWQQLTARRNRIAKGLMLMCAVTNFTGGYVCTHQGSDALCILGCINYAVGLWMLCMELDDLVDVDCLYAESGMFKFVVAV